MGLTVAPRTGFCRAEVGVWGGVGGTCGLLQLTEKPGHGYLDSLGLVELGAELGFGDADMAHTTRVAASHAGRK